MAADLSPAALLLRSPMERDYPISVPESSIGFESGNEVRVHIEGVSRRHAKITFDGKDYWIEDAGSSNGTFLNGMAVVRRERLRHLDVISLGRNVDLLFARKAIAVARVRRRGIVAAWIQAVDGVDAGERHEIPRGSITLGRAPSCNVVVSSALISKAHARLERSGLELVLTDLQSANGTFIDGKPVSSRVLQNGEEFSLGNARSFRVGIEVGEVETSGTPTAIGIEATAPRLPTDWKTRLDWTPEEKAVFEQLRSEAKAQTPAKPASAGKPTAKPQPAAKAQAKPEEAAQKSEAGVEPRPAPVPGQQPKKEPAAAAVAAPSSVPAAPAPPPKGPPERAAAKPSVPAAPAPSKAPTPPREIPPVSGSEPPSSQPEVPPLVAERRVYLEGRAQSFAVGLGDHVIGRVQPCALQLDSPQVSRRHAILHVSAGDVTIEDLASANGVFVNGKRVVARQPVADGDLVQFGDLGFRVRLGSKAPGSTRGG